MPIDRTTRRLAHWLGKVGTLAVTLAILPGCQAPSEGPVDKEETNLRAKTLADAIATARAGDTIELPAGIYEAGLTLPAGVKLRGAGMDKTVLDARKAEIGLTVSGGRGEVSDLTVRGASSIGVFVSHAESVTIRRVRATSNGNGIVLSEVAHGRLENVVGDFNRSGIVVTGGRDNAIVNCTLESNSGIGLKVASGEGLVAFNNCVARGGIGVEIDASAARTHLDYNLYDAPVVGRVVGQLGRKSIGPWQCVSGLDRNSVQLPVHFRNPPAGDFRPSGTLEWALDRAPTTDWGTAEFAGIQAPELDAAGSPRVGRCDVGAFEASPTPSRPPDGTLSIRSDSGIKSAGLFAPGGREVAYLFHNLPLRKGVYSFWFPARDFQGKAVAAGTYELKTVESALEASYLRWVGDTGDVSPPSVSASTFPSHVAFDEQGHLFLGQRRAPDATMLRAYDAASGRRLWSAAGDSDVQGLAVGSDGFLYVLTSKDGKGRINRIDRETGKATPWGDRKDGARLLDFAADGLAELEGSLFLSEAGKDLVRFGPTSEPTFASQVAVDAPSGLCADPSTHQLWVISRGDRLKALDASGKVLAETTPVAEPIALAARGGRIAVASRKTRKVHLFDVADPKAPKPLGTIGADDGPYGPVQPDRFTFPSAESGVHLALGPQGELACTDSHRLLVFNRERQPDWSTFGLSGKGTLPSFGNSQRHFDGDGRISLRLDETGAQWSPEATWDLPIAGEFLGTFEDVGRTFGVTILKPAGVPSGSLLVVRFDAFKAEPVLLMTHDPIGGRVLSRKDSNRDGSLDKNDLTAALISSSDALPLKDSNLFPEAVAFLQPNGDVLALGIHPDYWGVLWRRRGLDAEGIPVYPLEDARVFPKDRAGIVSPYDFRADEWEGFAGASITDEGGLIGLVKLRSAPGGTGLLKHAGTDVAGFDAAGKLLWLHPASRHKGLEGLTTVGPVTLTGVGDSCEIVALNRDGLGLGSFGPPAEMRYSGFFLDHPRAVRAYKGRDGHIYVLVADDLAGMHHWWRLAGDDQIVSTSSLITLSELAVKALSGSSGKAK